MSQEERATIAPGIARAPHPDLSPRDVVTAQLAAMQNNDEPAADHGIAQAYQFASPGNRAVTGPLERFVGLVKNPIYRPLLNHRRAELGMGFQHGDDAWQEVLIVDETGRRIVYEFGLSRIAETGCWMTDSVMPRGT
jgi:hypothetical protein